MKQLLLSILILLSLSVNSQTIPGNTTVNERRISIGLSATGNLTAPSGNSPTLTYPAWQRSGALWVDSVGSDAGFYHYRTGSWRRNLEWADTTSTLATQYDITQQNINDSIGYGYRLAEISVTGQTNEPPDLNWNKIHTQRVQTPIDENFIQYKSRFQLGNITEFSVERGSASTVSTDGKLTVTGRTILKSKSGPSAAWFAVQMNYSSMAIGGSTNTLGPALVKDSTNYIAALYNRTTGVFTINVNGSAILTRTVAVNPFNMTVTLVGNGSSLNVWVKTDDRTMWLGNADCSFDMQASGVINDYKYGLVSDQNSAATHYVNSLRGGVAGGVGLLNVRMVVNEDGSPYMIGNKTLITADWAALGVDPHEFTQSHATVFMVDIETFQIDPVGHFYVERNQGGTSRVVGATDIKLSWFPSLKKWLFVYALADWPHSLQTQNDKYAWLEQSAPFGVTIVDSTQLNSFSGFPAGLTSLIYDANPRKIGNTWYVPAGNMVSPTLGNPILLSGTSLSNLTDTLQYSHADFYESVTWAKLGGEWYLLYATFGEDKILVLSVPEFREVGFLDLPYGGVEAEIPGYDWLVVQKNGKTKYRLIGFDIDETTISNQSSATEYEWSRGNLVVWESDSISTGYEFPIRIANQMPPIQKDAEESFIKSVNIEDGSTVNSGVLFRTDYYSIKSDPSGLFYDDTNNRLGIGRTTPTDPLHIQKDQNNPTYLKIQNATSGTGAEATIKFVSSDTSYIGMNSATTTAYGIATANSLKLYTPNSAGIAALFDNAGGSFRFGGTSGAEVGRFDNTGLLMTGKIQNTNNNTSDYQLRVGTFLTQSHSTNNGFVADNAYYNGTTWTRLTNGYATGFQFYQGQLMIFNEGTGSGAFTQSVNLKIDESGNFGVGDAIPATNGDFTGSKFFISSAGKPTFDATITTAGTTGNQTINKPSGTVNIAAAGTTVTVTNSLVSASSIVLAVIRTNDGTATIKNVVPGPGSFVINLGAAATAEISIGWLVIN